MPVIDIGCCALCRGFDSYTEQIFLHGLQKVVPGLAVCVCEYTGVISRGQHRIFSLIKKQKDRFTTI